jgi:hypothetical protein
VARDARLASHEGLLAELANALRIFGQEATEHVIADICTRALGDTRPPKASCDFDFDDEDDLREEQYEGYTIRVMRDLWCRVQNRDKLYSYRPDYYEGVFPYVFAARAAIRRGEFEKEVARRRRKT